MPIYEYKCNDCQQIFEEWQRTYDTSGKCCPVCGGNAEHIISNTSFMLKGSGWYSTEYGNRVSPDKQAPETSTPEPSASPTAPAPDASTSGTTAT